MASANHIRRLAIIGLSLGLIGLAFCEIVQWLFFENERQMMQDPFWSKTIIGFGAIFLLSVMLVPIQVLILERRERRQQPLPKMTIADAIGVLLGGSFTREARVPNWIRIPVLAVLFLLLGVFLLAFMLWLLTRFV